ncbi:MAG TPA: methylmalonyl-CoA epimerase [Bacillus sp. (in: firmicutes)]|uniref:methylmalonyl-CoA epimerase n=1 Tax=Bacillus litorisediminis TaxID=2922713 RepID=UPI001FADCD85|nr:methylmalonyl-CoA epimerase [Bacillus litorisediminis]HWO76185.1 methylmalonyl-CoA epimerase [Bacillus sp. (in: firmicutes)]
MEKVDHIGIAVRSIEGVLPFYKNVMQLELIKTEEVESEGVRVAFLQAHNTKIELLEPLHKESPVAKFIEKRGEGIHHLAFLVQNIETEIQRLKFQGAQLLQEQPKRGAGGAKVVFLHPKQANGVLYEICER